jgi:hypothetical protein
VNTKGLLIFFGIPALTITTLLFVNNLAFLGGDTPGAGNQTQQSSQSANSEGVPIPNDKDFITIFFQALKEKNSTLLLGMLDPSIRKTDDDIKAWGNQFAAFETVDLKDVQPANEAEWKATEHTYKVTVTAKMTLESAKATIPYYGWGNGDTVKWVTVRKGEDGLWRILGFASGM